MFQQQSFYDALNNPELQALRMQAMGGAGTQAPIDFNVLKNLVESNSAGAADILKSGIPWANQGAKFGASMGGMGEAFNAARTANPLELLQGLLGRAAPAVGAVGRFGAKVVGGALNPLSVGTEVGSDYIPALYNFAQGQGSVGSDWMEAASHAKGWVPWIAGKAGKAAGGGAELQEVDPPYAKDPMTGMFSFNLQSAEGVREYKDALTQLQNGTPNELSDAQASALNALVNHKAAGGAPASVWRNASDDAKAAYMNLVSGGGMGGKADDSKGAGGSASSAPETSDMQKQMQVLARIDSHIDSQVAPEPAKQRMRVQAVQELQETSKGKMDPTLMSAWIQHGSALPTAIMQNRMAMMGPDSLYGKAILQQLQNQGQLGVAQVNKSTAMEQAAMTEAAKDPQIADWFAGRGTGFGSGIRRTLHGMAPAPAVMGGIQSSMMNPNIGGGVPNQIQAQMQQMFPTLFGGMGGQSSLDANSQAAQQMTAQMAAQKAMGQ
jgi:hypothetical protein